MINLALIVILLVGQTAPQVTSSTWVNWNTYAVDVGYTTPSPPTIVGATVSRLSPNSNGTYNLRSNQYALNVSVVTLFGPVECIVECGPRSFLTTVSGQYVCQRDQGYYASLS